MQACKRQVYCLKHNRAHGAIQSGKREKKSFLSTDQIIKASENIVERLSKAFHLLLESLQEHAVDPGQPFLAE